jgi:hypothetical protein
MTGVEILAAEEVATAFAFDWGNAILAGISSFLVVWGMLFFSLVVLDKYDFYTSFTIAISVGLFVGIITAAFTGVATKRYPIDYETRYEITVDDSVSMNEFNEKYEIIYQEGKVYTVREREK